MAAQQTSALPPDPRGEWNLVPVSVFPRLRALAWSGDVLYASRGYSLLRAKMMGTRQAEWEHVARHVPAPWRNFSSSWRLSFRLFRDGFHALAALSSGHLVAAVPGAIVTLAPGETEFRASHKVLRGTRPLHIAVSPNDQVLWGEYFDNPQREEVHIYASIDRGATWDVACTFPKGSIRHVHNIVYDPWENCFWVLTGDNGAECRILRADCDFSRVDAVLSGNQQARAVACVPMADGLYFSSDTPFETNHVYRLDRGGQEFFFSADISRVAIEIEVAESPLRDRNRVVLQADAAVVVQHGNASGIVVAAIVRLFREEHVILAKFAGRRVEVRLRRFVPESEMAFLPRHQVRIENAPVVMQAIRK